MSACRPSIFVAAAKAGAWPEPGNRVSKRPGTGGGKAAGAGPGGSAPSTAEAHQGSAEHTASEHGGAAGGRRWCARSRPRSRPRSLRDHGATAGHPRGKRTPRACRGALPDRADAAAPFRPVPLGPGEIAHVPRISPAPMRARCAGCVCCVSGAFALRINTPCVPYCGHETPFRIVGTKRRCVRGAPRLARAGGIAWRAQVAARLAGGAGGLERGRRRS